MNLGHYLVPVVLFVVCSVCGLVIAMLQATGVDYLTLSDEDRERFVRDDYDHAHGWRVGKR